MGKVNVTAIYEIEEKLAPQLADWFIATVTANFHCKLVGIDYAKQELQQIQCADQAIGQGDGVESVISDAGENGELAGRERENAKESSRGRTNKRKTRPVPC